MRHDPVCAQHNPQDTHEERYLMGAACHGCVLIAETSCERFNQYLDRSLVVPNVATLGTEFFDDTGLSAKPVARCHARSLGRSRRRTAETSIFDASNG